jgi:predicted ester cyclase
MSEQNKQVVWRYFEELDHGKAHGPGPFMGVPASGRPVSAVGVGVFRVATGKVTEFWVSPDRMSLMQQMGVLPVQEQANVGARS